MSHSTYSRNIPRCSWTATEDAEWLTDCVPPPSTHLAGDFRDWPDFNEYREAPVDADIIEGRLHSFDSIEELIANMKKQPPVP